MTAQIIQFPATKIIHIDRCQCPGCCFTISHITVEQHVAIGLDQPCPDCQEFMVSEFVMLERRE